jgi:hypothetical protein
MGRTHGLANRLHFGARREPKLTEDRPEGRYHRDLKKWQRSDMTQQTAMVRRLVRLVLRRRGVGLGRHRRAEDKEDDPSLANGLKPRNHAG